jgi:hypothetical protein
MPHNLPAAIWWLISSFHLSVVQGIGVQYLTSANHVISSQKERNWSSISTALQSFKFAKFSRRQNNEISKFSFSLSNFLFSFGELEKQICSELSGSGRRL